MTPDAALYDGSKGSIAAISRLVGNSMMLYSDHIVIKTASGNHRVEIGAWVIKVGRNVTVKEP